MIRSAGEIPPAFWEDAFVLGFLFYYMHAVAVRAGETPAEYSDMPRAYVMACGDDLGVEVLQRTMAFSMEQDPNYLEGLKAGDKFISIIYGSKAYDCDPDVVNARKRALATKLELQKDVQIDLSDAEHAYLLEAIFLSKVRWRVGKQLLN